jgi:hypothetical protein
VHLAQQCGYAQTSKLIFTAERYTSYRYLLPVVGSMSTASAEPVGLTDKAYHCHKEDALFVSWSNT